MDEREYDILLPELNAAIRVWRRKDRGRILRFVVQLEAYLDERWTPITRFDNAHKFIHRDDLRPDGAQIKSSPMSFRSNADALNYAIREFRNNGRFFIERYEQWKK